MTRRTTLRGLLDLPLDWLLLPWAVAIVLSQWWTRLPGQQVVRVRGVQVSVSDVALGVEVRERLLLALLVTVVVWLFPAGLRRSIRTWRDHPSRGEKWLFDSPFHRDPMFWFAVIIWATSLTVGQVIPHLEFRSGGAAIGVPLRETFTVDGSYLWCVLGGLFQMGLTGILVGMGVGLRGLYRGMGEPSRRGLRRQARRA
jgi:hypothetical protein